ncbi:hypothetical protein MRB53_039881 [Persea americana]|nr:hypothetical protein MRB53_039881 [Persea americana]
MLLLTRLSSLLPAIGHAAAAAIGVQQHPINSLSAHKTISSAHLEHLTTLARLVDISYCVAGPATTLSPPFTCPSYCSTFPDLTLIDTWDTGALTADSCGYLAVDSNPANPRIIVAFRGTYSPSNIITDLRNTHQPFVPYPPRINDTIQKAHTHVDHDSCASCRVHTGFYKSYLATRPYLLPPLLRILSDPTFRNHTLHFIGHSSGGAQALFFGLELRTRGYNAYMTTFGEPRAGNDNFARYVDRVFSNKNGSTSNVLRTYTRVTRIDDPVPLLPPREWKYASHGDELFIRASDLPFVATDVIVCEGAEDQQCSAGGERTGFRGWVTRGFNMRRMLFEHRDYFIRLGLCVPKDYSEGRIRSWWRAWEHAHGI